MYSDPLTIVCSQCYWDTDVGKFESSWTEWGIESKEHTAKLVMKDQTVQ